MNKHIPESDLVTPKVTTGALPASRKIYSTPDAAPDLAVPLREITLIRSPGEPPLPLYDPSGPYTDPDAAIDVGQGLPRARARLGDASAAASSTTMAATSGRRTTAMFPATSSRAPSRMRRAPARSPGSR